MVSKIENKTFYVLKHSNATITIYRNLSNFTSSSSDQSGDNSQPYIVNFTTEIDNVNKALVEDISSYQDGSFNIENNFIYDSLDQLSEDFNNDEVLIAKIQEAFVEIPYHY